MSNCENKYNVLVVGAGGIGCELLKNLVYCGFKKISVIDLDTIDVSNLNRQFLFRKRHVGESKAIVACESIRQFRDDVDLTPYHASIFSCQFGPEFFNAFDIVFNALDNQAARRHVNRMCVSIGKPIIESGTAGYLGQVEPLIFAKPVGRVPQAPCFECTARENDKRTYPTCTIRNTPSEPVHCVVWAKFLFNQLFGEADFETEDVSPDVDDPEVAKANNVDPSSGDKAEAPKAESSKPDTHTSLWARALSSNTEAGLPLDQALLMRLFETDVRTLLSMESLWKDRPDRQQPDPLTLQQLQAGIDHPGLDAAEGLRDQWKMDLEGWIKLFFTSCAALRKRACIAEDGIVPVDHKPISWDKDDQDAMDFVAAASIIRALLFHIPGAADLTRFAVKSLAGNIVPAVATTNAVIAGAMVIQALNVLKNRVQAIRTLYLHRQPAGFGRFLVACRPCGPNPACLVCSGGPAPELRLLCDPAQMRLLQLREDVLIKRLGMIAPDVEVDGKASILISSDGDETKEIEDKTLADFKLTGEPGTNHRLRCDDFRQSMTFYLQIVARTAASRGREEAAWSIEGEFDSLKEDAASASESAQKAMAVDTERPETGTKRTHELSSDEGLMIDLDCDDTASVAKKARMEIPAEASVVNDDNDDDVIFLD